MAKALNDIMSQFGEANDLIKKLEEQRIRTVWAPGVRSKQTAIRKKYDKEIRKAAEESKSAIQSFYNQLDNSEVMMGSMSKKVKETVETHQNKYDEILPR